VFVQVKPTKTVRCAAAFLKALHTACPIHIRRVLTDNGKEFTDRFVTAGERAPTGQHVFDHLSEALGIEHRLTRPRRPQTNGRVERFNGRIADVLRTHHFRSRDPQGPERPDPGTGAPGLVPITSRSFLPKAN
jgi:transposase InsO family protein